MRVLQSDSLSSPVLPLLPWQLEALRAELQEARAELSGLYKDKSKALEEALAAQRELVAVKAKAAEQAEELTRQVRMSHLPVYCGCITVDWSM